MYEEIAANKRNSILLIIGFMLFIVGLSYVFGAVTGGGYFVTVFTVFLAVAMAVGSYYYSDKIVLRLSGARPATKQEFPYLYNVVEGLALAAGLPKPKLYVLDDTALNAFATGRDPEHGVIVVTTGLLQRLNRQELEGVIAHEMSHIKNYDIRFMTLVTVLVGVVTLLADFMLRSFLWGGNRRGSGRVGVVMIVIGLALMILAPIVATVIKLAVSRQREFLADASGALLTRYPEGLASALEKLNADKEPLEAANKATAHLYIADPLKNLPGFLNGLFATHPPIPERVKRLRAM